MQRIFATIAAGIIGLAAASPAFAQSIPQGYMLVPVGGLAQPGAMNYFPAQQFAAPQTAVSPELSSIRAKKDFGFVGEEISVFVTLRDAAGEPVADRAVHLVASRSEDRVAAVRATTDANGEALFKVVASKEGISTLSALDASSGTAVAERPRLVFIEPAARGGDAKLLQSSLLGAQVLAADTASSQSFSQQLKIEFPKSVVAGKASDITISIVDKTGALVEDFTGAVSFQSTDTAAILPKNYTFTEVDAGEHVFSKAVTFSKPGSYQIVASSSGVGSATTSVTVLGATASADAPTIASPTDSDFVPADFTVSGTASANVNLAVLVDDTVVTRGESDADGNYNIELIGQEDGGKTLAVAVESADGSLLAKSAPISIAVDGTNPIFKGLELKPGAVVVAGEKVEVTVNAEPSLAEVTLLIDDIELTLVETARGVYSGEINTKAINDYLLSVRLRDAAGNETTEQDVSALRVTDQLPQDTVPAVELFAIDSVQLTPRDARVELRWPAPSTTGSENIVNYRIKYGMFADALDQEFLTADARTAWFIGELQNDTEYTFQVEALDALGEVIGQSSQLAATPTTELGMLATVCSDQVELNWKAQTNADIARYEVAYGIAPGSYTESVSVPASQTSTRIESLIPGQEYYFTVRGMDARGQVVFATNEEISAAPGGAACHSAATPQLPLLPVTLKLTRDSAGNPIVSWDAVPGAASYRVYAGTRPGIFDLPILTVSGTQFAPRGLAQDRDYYFAVRALGSDGREAPVYSNVLQVHVGPELLIALSAAGSLAGAWAIRRKKKNLAA